MANDSERPPCRCCASSGIHGDFDANGTIEKPYAYTFGTGELDDFGYWEFGCSKCARWHELQDGMPVGTYWPFE